MGTRNPTEPIILQNDKDECDWPTSLSQDQGDWLIGYKYCLLEILRIPRINSIVRINTLSKCYFFKIAHDFVGFEDTLVSEQHVQEQREGVEVW